MKTTTRPEIMFVISLGICRDCMRGWADWSMPKSLLPVVPFDQVWEVLGKGWSGTTYIARADVPEAHVICAECGKGWTLANVHDALVRRESRVVPLTPGKSIEAREKDFDTCTDGVYSFGSDCGVRNPKFIDLSPDPQIKGLIVNENGWRYQHPPFNHERTPRSYIAEDGDTCSIDVWLYEHTRCNSLRKSREERTYFTDIFTKAGMERAVLHEIPNGYCPCEKCAPWYIAKMPYGDIKIGWRKRVISIDWSSTKRNLLHLFKDEDVTKEPYLVHAWGTDKAVDYLKRIHGAME